MHTRGVLTDNSCQLILYIHYLAENAALASVHPTIYQNLHYASNRYKAKYLLSLHRSAGTSQVILKCASHPVCTVDVLKTIRNLNPTLRCPSLPTRLFRIRTPDEPIPPLLLYLIDTYSPSVRHPNGYPLTRSVLSGHIPLIRYLLDKGARPGDRDGYAVRIAVQTRRLDIVKLLMNFKGPQKYKAKSDMVELAMANGADDIVQYFVKDGVMPPLKSIMKMNSRKRRRT